MVYRAGVKLTLDRMNHGTNLQKSVAVDDLGEAKVRNLYHGWLVRSQQNVLHDEVPLVKSQDPRKFPYFGFQISMSDPFAVNILQEEIRH